MSQKNNLINRIEGILFASRVPLSAETISKMLVEEAEAEVMKVPLGEIRQALSQLVTEYETRGIHLVEVASGYRFQVAADVASYVVKSLEDKPARYSRALLVTLALIAYRQPITRGEIEDIRGVVVSTHIIKTLDEHEWIRIVGYKDVPGKPALYATTKYFLNHFGLKTLEELPPLAALKDFEGFASALDQETLEPVNAIKEEEEEKEKISETLSSSELSSEDDFDFEALIESELAEVELE